MDSKATSSDKNHASFGLEPDRKGTSLSRGAKQPEKKAEPKSKAKTTPKNKQPKVAPLPAIVKVCGYEVTIPNTKTCWRVKIVYSCGHPVMDVSQVRQPGHEKPLIAEINRHMRPCAEKCKVDEISHVAEGLCSWCQQSEDNEEKQTSSIGDSNGNVGGPGIVWHGMPQL